MNRKLDNEKMFNIFREIPVIATVNYYTATGMDDVKKSDHTKWW